MASDYTSQNEKIAKYFYGSHNTYITWNNLPAAVPSVGSEGADGPGDSM